MGWYVMLRLSVSDVLDISTRISFWISSSRILIGFVKGIRAEGSGCGGSHSSPCIDVSYSHSSLATFKYLAREANVFEHISAWISEVQHPSLVLRLDMFLDTVIVQRIGDIFLGHLKYLNG